MRCNRNQLAGFFVGFVAVLTGSAAFGSLVVNLRFADGSLTHAVSAADVGHDVEVDVWASITGLNPASASNFYGLQFLYYSVVSSLPNGPGTGVAGGLAGGVTPDGNLNALVAPFNAPGSQVGVTQDLNNDGVVDLGSNNVTTDAAKPRGSDPTTGAIFNDYPTGAKDALANGYEFEVEKLYFHVNSLAGSQTVFTAGPPANIQDTPSFPLAIWYEDAPTDSAPTSGLKLGAVSSGTSVTLAVPEPNGLVLTMLFAGAMLARASRPVEAVSRIK